MKKYTIIKDSKYSRNEEQSKKFKEREEEKKRELAESRQKSAAKSKVKKEKMQTYVDKIDDVINKITNAVNADVADSLYEDGLQAIKDFKEFLADDAKANGFHNIPTSQLEIVLTKFNELEVALKQKYNDASRKDSDMATELISLVTNSKNYFGENRDRIDKIIETLNKDYDYKYLSKSELRNLKRKLNIIEPSLASRISDSCTKDVNDTVYYIDVVKATNRMMFDQRQEPGYLGCNVSMNRADDNAFSISVTLGFDKKPADTAGTAVDAKAIADDVVKAVSTLYETVDSMSYTEKDYPKRQQYEIIVSMTAKESKQSEERVAKAKEEEAKKTEAERQEELKKRVAEEESKKEQLKKEREGKTISDRYAEKLAKCKTQNQLDVVFDEVEDLNESGKITDSQFKMLSDIYNEAEKRIANKQNDDSLLLKIMYSRQIKKADSTSDLQRITKAMYNDNISDRLDDATYDYLAKLMKARERKILTPGGTSDSTSRQDEYDIKNNKGHYEAYLNGKFVASADTYAELMKELESMPIKPTKSIKLDKVKLKDLHDGYAVVKRTHFDEYGYDAYVYRVCDTLRDAKDSATSLLLHDNVQYVVIDCAHKLVVDKSTKDVKPRKNESKAEFIERFMSATKKEYPDNKQRLAVAYSYWKNKD